MSVNGTTISGRSPCTHYGGEIGVMGGISLVRQLLFAGLMDELRALQGEQPLVPACVDAQIVAEIISAWTGIPLGRMVNDEIRTVLQLQPMLAERVIGYTPPVVQRALGP